MLAALLAAAQQAGQLEYVPYDWHTGAGAQQRVDRSAGCIGHNRQAIGHGRESLRILRPMHGAFELLHNGVAVEGQRGELTAGRRDERQAG